MLQIHDELIVECPEEAGEQANSPDFGRKKWMRVAKLNVPLIADAHIGKNWLDAKLRRKAG